MTFWLWPLLLIALGVFVTWQLFRPEKGWVWGWMKWRDLRERMLREDAVKHLYKCEVAERRPTTESLAGVLEIGRDAVVDLLEALQEHDLVVIRGDRIQLTPNGRDYALHVIRAHRLWERYLSEQTGYERAEWHTRAEKAEHLLTPMGAQTLSAQLGHPTHDPHGDPIPTAGGEIVRQEDQTLSSASTKGWQRIVHLEDEPEAVYAQLVAEGLYVGQAVRLLEVAPQRIRFWADGDEHVLAPLLAANVSVRPLDAADAHLDDGSVRLSSLQVGQQGVVSSIARSLRGSERRRLYDLGLLPGTEIVAELVSPGGDPTAYRIRDALIALRREQTEQIWVKRASQGQREGNGVDI